MKEPVAKPCGRCKTMTVFHAKPCGRYRHICNACKAAYAREWRKGNAKAKAAERVRWQRRVADPMERPKRVARLIVKNAITRGDLTPAPCEVCGVQEAEAHHDDYSKPLDVRWLCKRHHHDLHLQLASAANERTPIKDTQHD